MKIQKEKFENLENTEKSLYIRILIWVYNKQEKGFTWGELQDAFNLNNKQQQWVEKIFHSNMPASDNLVDHLNINSREEGNLFVITSRGINFAINYLNLKEAEKSSKRAEIIAIIAIIIGIVVGLAQIITSLCLTNKGDCNNPHQSYFKEFNRIERHYK